MTNINILFLVTLTNYYYYLEYIYLLADFSDALLIFLFIFFITTAVFLKKDLFLNIFLNKRNFNKKNLVNNIFITGAYYNSLFIFYKSRCLFSRVLVKKIK